jgi:SynChlorMet cassette radical SAM/SPASM protein ScmF
MEVQLPKGIPPLTEIYLYVTGACNLNCRHCWIDPEFGTPDQHLPWADLRTIVEQAQELGLRRIKITGGEPFVYPDMVDMLYALSEMELSIRMETNGTLIGEREARALREAQASFAISIDGPTAELHDDLRGVTGAFQRTLRGIEHVRQEGLSFQVIACLYRKNSEHMSEMIDLARDLGSHSLKINPITGDGRSEEMAVQGELLSLGEILEIQSSLTQQGSGEAFQVCFDVPPAFKSLSEIRQHGSGTCGILNILGVLHNGHGGVCGIGEHVEELDFGDLLELGVRQVWEENEVLGKIRANVPHNLGGICGRCIFRNYCLGKCLAHTYYSTQDLFEGFPFCEQALAQGLFPTSRVVDHR